MMKLAEFVYTVDVTEKRPTDDGLGTKKVKVGEEEVTVMVTYEAGRLRGFASRAIKNRTGKTVDGPLTAKVVMRHRMK